MTDMFDGLSMERGYRTSYRANREGRQMRKLNLGCGEDIKKGWINLDKHNDYSANVIHDITNPLPFDDNYFDYVLCSHVIEDFIDPLPLIDEMIRITRKGGYITIKVPNETCAWISLNHKRGFSLNSFIHFSKRKDYNYKNNVDLVNYEYYLDGNKFHHKIVAWFWNTIPKKIMDFTFLKSIFPYIYLKVVYRVL